MEIYTGQSITFGQLRRMNADVIILAVGSVSVMPKVSGMDDKKVLDCDHLEKVGQKVVVIGGGLVVCEMALEYA